MTSTHTFPTDPIDLGPKTVSRLVIDGFYDGFDPQPASAISLCAALRDEVRRIVAGAPGGTVEVACRSARAYGVACALLTILSGHTEDEGWDFMLDRVDDLNATVGSLLSLLGTALSRGQLTASVLRYLGPLQDASDDDLGDPDAASDLLLAAANLIALAVAVR